MKNLSLIVKYVFITPWCPANKLECYRVITLSTHDSETARTAASCSGIILNNSESSRILIASLEDGSLFCDKYEYRSLKYELYKHPTCISLTLTGK